MLPCQPLPSAFPPTLPLSPLLFAAGADVSTGNSSSTCSSTSAPCTTCCPSSSELLRELSCACSLLPLSTSLADTRTRWMDLGSCSSAQDRR